MKSKLLRRILFIFLVSSAIFICLVAASYLLSIEPGNAFELGLPFKFYYQFPAKKEMLHGTIPLHFIYDAILVLCTTTFISIWVWTGKGKAII